MGWVLLALASAVFWAGTDLFAKRALGHLPVAAVAWARVALPVPALAVAVALWGWETPRGPFWWALGAALPLEVLAALLQQRALQLSPLGLTAPYLAFTPAFLAVTGRWILGEVPTGWAYGGIALVTLGGYWLQLDPGAGFWGPIRSLRRERGSVLMLGVAFLYSLTAALGKVAVVHSNPATFALVYYAAVSVALAPWAFQSVRHLARPRFGEALPVGLLGAAMILTHLAAIRIAPASYMIAVKRTSLLWSILLGGLVLKEPHLGRRLAAGLAMMAGVVALAASF
ncbi:MAG: hypothetical protein Kow0092_30900 [Deferrisomatales bacterium]